jgi:DNA replication protein DnaC
VRPCLLWFVRAGGRNAPAADLRPHGRFTTAAALVNELVEAKQNNQVRRLMARWQKYELIALDEVGYVPLADIGAEFLFQVIAERAERAALTCRPRYVCSSSRTKNRRPTQFRITRRSTCS